jgi:hypothetical protein
MSNTGNNMNQFSDEELDRDWKPNGRRPQSCVSLSYFPQLGLIWDHGLTAS